MARVHETVGAGPTAAASSGSWLEPAALRRRPLTPVIFILALLLALAALTVAIEQQALEVHGDIESVAGPTRETVTDIQLALALETASVRGYLLTGSNLYDARHEEARARRKEAVAELSEIARRTAPEVQALAARLAAELQPADALLDSLFDGRISRDEYIVRLPVQQARFEQVSGTVHDIDEVVQGSTVSKVAWLQDMHRNAMIVTLGLLALAGLAAVLVSRLGAAYRAMAQRELAAHLESEAARDEAVRRRRETEMLSASRARLARGFTHDVKNPLGAAMGYLDLMAEGVIDSKTGARQAKRAVAQALHLIDELLQLERDRTGEVVVRRREFDLTDVAREVVNDCRALAAGRGLGIITDIPELPPIHSDPERVRQILGNFMSNAVRYTQKGTITVTAEIRAGASADPSSSPAWAAVSVQDTGPGLTAEQRRELFQEFRRLGTADGTKGSGIGLAISKRLADALGARIEVESEPGVGSCFTLLLPHDAVSSRATLPAQAETATA